MTTQTHPLDYVQAGYLILKLWESGIVTEDEARRSLAVLFPELLPFGTEDQPRAV